MSYQGIPNRNVRMGQMLQQNPGQIPQQPMGQMMAQQQPMGAQPIGQRTFSDPAMQPQGQMMRPPGTPGPNLALNPYQRWR